MQLFTLLHSKEGYGEYLLTITVHRLVHGSVIHSDPPPTEIQMSEMHCTDYAMYIESPCVCCSHYSNDNDAQYVMQM